MATNLQGAYVQAWVWVDLRSDTGECIDDATISDSEVVQRARARWSREGEIEIDERTGDGNPGVSRSYED